MPIDYFQLAADLARAQAPAVACPPQLTGDGYYPSAGTGEIPALLTRAELRRLVDDTHALEQVIAEMEAES